MSAPGQVTIIRKRKRRRRRRTPLFPFILLALLILGGVAGFRWVINRRPIATRQLLPAGYIAETAAFNQEYGKYFGDPLVDRDALGRFRQASEAAGKGSLPGATSMLETIVKTAGLPVVFHNLGVAYAGLSDYTRAADAFREALARDPEYSATRKFLREAKGIPTGAAEPYTREQEPNNEPADANVIGLRGPVGGELAGGNDAADYFKVIAPAAPRDLLTIELANHSINFAPRVHVYDQDLRLLSWGDVTARPGASITVSGGPPSNTVLFISVTAADANGGQYLLTVMPQKAFDKYEPNDDLQRARRVSIGEEIAAGIMDGGDSDFFSFQSPRRGTVIIDVQNRSNTLIPALSMYNSDHRNLAFAQEVRKPGADVRYVLDADKDALYYVQISSQSGTAGAYTLRVD
jgi:tetratricopeptide (TPR) repeat protein